jgi:hypothetical protein
MSDREKDPPPDDLDPPDLELEQLPPIDDGDIEPPCLDDLGVIVGADETDDDGATGLDDLSADGFAQELGEFEGSAWADEIEGAAAFTSDAEFDEEDEGWAEGGEAAAPLDDPWFDDDLDAEAAEDDGGAEGPIAEPDDALGEAGEDPEVLYLGPVRGHVTGIAVVVGALLAVGDGLYRVGADGLLHRYDAEDEIDAVSVCTAGATVFVGTEQRGLLRAEGFDCAPAPFGVWLDARRGVERELSGQFAVFGQRLEERFRLVGLTGEGELLASDDEGHTWRGPLAEQRCLAIAQWEGEASIVALVDDEEGPALLLWDGASAWRRLCAQCPVDVADRAAKVSIAAAGGVIVVGSDRPGVPLRVSMDRGESFSEVAAVTGVTAIAVDAHEPGWIAAATFDPDEGVGAVRVSRDGGKTWRTTFTTGRAEEREEPVRRPGRVTFLAVVGDDVRLLCAATGEGVYSAPLPGGAASH